MAAPAISFLVTKRPSSISVETATLKIGAGFEVVNPEYTKQQSESLDAWLWQLRDAVEEAEDAIDELEYHELKEKVKDQKRLRNAVVRLDEVAAGVASFITLVDHIKEVPSNSWNGDHFLNGSRETGSILTATAVFGRVNEKGQIVEWLTKTNRGKR